MNSWSPQCTHSQKEYRQLYDLVEQSGPATINASNSHVESHGVQTITLTHIHMSPTLSLSQRIALLERIIRSGCSKCALDLTQKAVCWLNNPESGLTNRAILYLVTAYKIEKKCKGDTTEIETKIWEVVSCYPCQRENNLLHHFIESEAFPIIRYLLKCQFQGEVKSWLEQKNEKGRLPIHTAIMQGNIETVRLLLRFCPSQLLNTQDKDGNTLLHLAVQQAIESKEDRKKFEPVIKDLLKRNANPEIENSKREKPFDLACDSEEVKAIFFTSHSFCLGHVKNKMTDFYQSNGGEIERSLLVNAPPLKIEQCFINLSIVKEKVQKNTETEALGKREKREQIFGGYEDVFKTVNKEPIFPKDLFEPREGKTPKRLLILGRAGIGKSTLCKYLTHQCWSADGVWKNRFALVVKINLRNLTKERYPNKNVSLAEIIVRECFKPTDEEKKEIKYINKVLASISAEQKLFLLDGYDEFPADSPCKATINTLLNPQNDSYLIVTSRPYAKVNSENFDFSLECIGFTSEDIPKYLNLPGVCKDADTAKKILAFLKQNPAIHNLAHIPILLDLLTLSNEVILASESVTITKLYEHIVTKIWEKYDSKQLELNFDQKGVEATQEQAEQFLKALAFHSFLEHGIVFNYKSVEEVAIEACGWKKLQIASRVESLMTPGFLNCYRDKILTENQYSFPHLTIQEYQAALFITDWLSTDREIQVYKENTRKREKTTAQQFILKNRYNPRFQIIWHFMSGILADSKQEHLQDFFSCLLQEPKDIIGSYHTCLLIRCLEEAEIPDLENANLLTQLKNNCEILIRKKSMPLLDALNLSRKMVSKLEVMKLIVSLLKNHPSVDSYETPNVFLFFKELVKLRHSFPEESISILMKCLSIDRELISSSAGEVLGAIVQVEPDRSNQILTDLLKLSQGENDKAAFAAIYAIGEIGKSGQISLEAMSTVIGGLYLENKLFKSTASQALGKILTTGCSITDEAVSQLAKDIKIPDSEYVRANIASALGLIAVNKSSQSQEILTSLSEAIKDRSDTVRSKVVEVLSCIVQQQGAVAESAMAILLTTMQEEKNKHVQWVIFREIGRIIAKNTSLTQKMITQWLDLVSNLLSASYPTLGSKADHEIIIHRTVYNVRKIILPVLLASDSTLGDCQALLDNLKSQPFNCVNWFIQIIALGEVISSGTQIPSSIVDNLIEIWIEKIDIEFYENPTLYEAFCETLVQAVKFQKELSLEATEKLISKGDEGSAHILIAIVKASYCQLEHLVDQIENKLLTILENENKLANIIFDPYNNYILSHAVESGFKLKSQTVLCIIKAFNIKQFNKRLISHFNWIIDKMNLTPYRDFIKINISCPSRSLLSVFKNTPTIDILSNFHHVQRISEVILVRLAKSSLAICIDNTELCFSEDNKFYRVSLPIEFINELQRKLLDRA